MTNYIPTQSISTTDQHALSLVSGDSVLLNPGIVLSASGAGADGIHSGGIEDTILLRSGSRVSSENGTGIHVQAGSVVEIDAGASVSGRLQGVNIDASNRTDIMSTLLLNYGSITGEIGVRSNNSRLIEEQIVNHGSILGTNGAGLRLDGAVSVINTGTIEGSNGIVLGNPQALRVITNSGTIIGKDGPAISFNTANPYGDVVVNTGHIVGNISFSGQSNGSLIRGDLYDGRGGTITGTISLGSGHDRAFGGAGAETFEVRSGNDTIDGGGGHDTVLFNQNRSLYDVSTAGGVTTVASKGTPATDTDTLTNVRFLKFDDTTEILYNTKPDSVGLTQTTFAENALTGTPIATVAARDAEGDALTYTLVDPTGTFGLVGNALVLLKALDFET
ncbi:cadherin repeat domain-containing protein, partial [Microvirga sp. CF3016]|uniref:cadherin repeat domain-containing protein n=1 Tax=Microvirga sp. CF3016 TaxID=3110181 RepID=UPI002E79B9EA